MNVEQLETSLPEILTNYPSVALIYLFGSQATGSAGPLSDYDVGILVSGEGLALSPDLDRLCSQLAHDLAAALCTERIDLVLLNEAPIELQYAVIAQGKCLHQHDLATRVEYEARVMGAYGDYLPVLRAQRKDILGGDERETRVQRYRTALGRTRRALGEIASPQ